MEYAKLHLRVKVNKYDGVTGIIMNKKYFDVIKKIEGDKYINSIIKRYIKKGWNIKTHKRSGNVIFIFKKQ
jgi:hypothetical protein